ncbi:hypothetical protein OE88DRAFT_11704 [Heliocybe sulcata]|uniref:Uncharacterized protein n=1 Tax=Heliocybe sulcata TaxID=5364 RepID=A0A5C3NGB6_9AGAM|nr:hypothetical protein OE88DRAFT_11704 [Heliocybe sulcata]
MIFSVTFGTSPNPARPINYHPPLPSVHNIHRRRLPIPHPPPIHPRPLRPAHAHNHLRLPLPPPLHHPLPLRLPLPHHPPLLAPQHPRNEPHPLDQRYPRRRALGRGRQPHLLLRAQGRESAVARSDDTDQDRHGPRGGVGR